MKSSRFLASLALSIPLAALHAAEPARPNILWLTSEDHGPHLGCYGDPLARTPRASPGRAA